MPMTNVPSLIHNSDLSSKDKVVKAGLLVLQLMQTAPTIKLIEQCIKNGGGVIGSETIRKFMPEVYREISNAMRISQSLNENGLPEEVLNSLHSIMAFSAEAAETNLAFELAALETNKVLIQKQIDEANQLKLLKDNQFDMLKLQYDQLKENYNAKLADIDALQTKGRNMDEHFKSLSTFITQEKRNGEILSQAVNKAKLTIINLESKLSDSLLSNTQLKAEVTSTLEELHDTKDLNKNFTKQNQSLKDNNFELKFRLTNKDTDIHNLSHKLEKKQSLLKVSAKKSEAELEIMTKQSFEKIEKLTVELSEKNEQTLKYIDLTRDQRSNIMLLTEKLKLAAQHNSMLVKSEEKAVELLQKLKL